MFYNSDLLVKRIQTGTEFVPCEFVNNILFVFVLQYCEIFLIKFVFAEKSINTSFQHFKPLV